MEIEGKIRRICVICACVLCSILVVAIADDDFEQKTNFLSRRIPREKLLGTRLKLLAPLSGTIDSRRRRESVAEDKRLPTPTRHAKHHHRRRGRCRNNGTTCPRGQRRAKKSQQIQERRNFEKQILVRNRTLELLGRRILNSSPKRNDTGNDGAVAGAATVLERAMVSRKVGDILGETAAKPRLKITDLLVAKVYPKSREKDGLPDEVAGMRNSRGRNGTRKASPDDERKSSRDKTETANSSETGKKDISEENPESDSDERSSILRKLKTLPGGDSTANDSKPESGHSGTELEVSVGDFYKSGYRYDYENVFEDPSVSAWMNPSTSDQATTSRGDFVDSALLSSVYMPIDEQIALHESLVALLSRLFQTLRNSSAENNRRLLQNLDFEDSPQEDLCQKWLDFKDKLEEAFLGPLVSLPACPCHYPSSIFYDDKIWDEKLQKHFRWRDVSGDSERLDVYKPGASYCVRSLLAQGSGSAAAQHCCYDRRRRLLTRGSGAGTPNFVSPEVSAILHERIDVLPWRLCKGDFSRFNKVRPPNNDNLCKANPDDEEYQRQIDNTKYY